MYPCSYRFPSSLSAWFIQKELNLRGNGHQGFG